MVLARLVRRVRYGKPIVVVSGLPRSGTSMAMKMLEAGGLPVLSDGLRTADENNPKGYYELEAVKGLDKNGDSGWLDEARGKAVKIISFLLTFLPDTYDYRVIFMERDLTEVIASQNAMLLQRGESPGSAADDVRMRATYQQHLLKVKRFLSSRRCFSVLTVNYGHALHRPLEESRRIDEFLGLSLDVDRMAGVADPALYRNRKTASP
jgi:hypothetical protein